jgi:chorismate--pyruvate lyase
MKKSLEFNWKPQYTLQESAVSTPLQAWLLHSGSFMQRLAERGAVNPRVQVISQQWQYAEPWENKLLNINLPEEVLVREVLIVSDDKYWMYARSVFPRQMLTGAEAELAHLQTRPLGSVLFNHPEMQRSEFAFASLQPGMAWYEKIIKNINAPAVTSDDVFAQLWSRHSVFQLHEKSLLLTEVFLPDVAVL